MKDTPTPPPPPDPTAVSQAQEKSNIGSAASQSALNNVNQLTPYGSNTFSQTGEYVNDQGISVPQYTENTQLTPELQAILGQKQNIASGVLNTVENQIPNLNVGGINTNTPFSGLLNIAPKPVNAQPVNLNGAVPLPENAPISALNPENVSPLDNVNPTSVSSQHVNPQQHIDPLAPVNNSGTVDTRQYNTDVTNSIYSQQKGFLDPVWSQREQALNDQLSQQGITAQSNPEAYNRAMQEFNNSRTQAYQSAQDSATAQGAQFGNLAAALQVQQNQDQFGQSLASNENQFGQDVTAANTNFGQDVTAANTNFGQDVTAANTNFGQNLAANQNKFGQNVTSSSTNFQQQMQAEAALFEQMLQRGGNQFSQEMQNNQNQFGQEMGVNQNQFSQGWANQSNLFNLAMAGQQQNISQQLTQQNQPINLLTQLMGGAPQLQTQGQVNPANSTVAPTDVTGAYALNAQAAQNNYKAKLDSQNAMFGGLAGIGGSILAAPMTGGGSIAASLLGL